jgi:hypothetical protein
VVEISVLLSMLGSLEFLADVKCLKSYKGDGANRIRSDQRSSVDGRSPHLVVARCNSLYTVQHELDRTSVLLIFALSV